MDLTKAIRELYAEKEALDRAIAALEALSSPVISSRRRGRGPTIPEEDKEQFGEEEESTQHNGDRSPQ